jgi:hypothetical protein
MIRVSGLGSRRAPERPYKQRKGKRPYRQRGRDHSEGLITPQAMQAPALL